MHFLDSQDSKADVKERQTPPKLAKIKSVVDNANEDRNQGTESSPSGCHLISSKAPPVINKALTTPRHPIYTDPNIRLQTFREWPENNLVKPENLTTAGFYFTGHQDIVRCWYCDIGVRKWSKDDDAFVEHARWSPDCQFILQEKGTDFVRQVQIAHNKRKMEGKNQQDQDEYMKTSTDADLPDYSGAIISESATVKKKLMCMLCGLKEKNVLLLPCSHLELCEECGIATANCPRCRSSVKQKIKTYRY